MGEMLTWTAETTSSGIPGRALGRVRTNNFLVDDYAFAPYNGPGEEPGAAELFLSGVTACAVLMLERIARNDGLPLGRVEARMEAWRDPSVVRTPAVFDRAHLDLTLSGLTAAEADQLVETFRNT